MPDVKETEPGIYDVYSNRGKLHCGRPEKFWKNSKS